MCMSMCVTSQVVPGMLVYVGSVILSPTFTKLLNDETQGETHSLASNLFSILNSIQKLKSNSNRFNTFFLVSKLSDSSPTSLPIRPHRPFPVVYVYVCVHVRVYRMVS